MYGVPVLNSTNTYMNTDLWEVLDPDKQFEDLYNRYSHILIELADTDKLEIKEPLPLQIQMVVNAEMLEKAGVKYLLSEKDLTVFSSERISIRPVFESPDVNYTIFLLERV